MDLPDIRKITGEGQRSPRELARIQILCPLSKLPDNLKPLLHRKDVQSSWVLHVEMAEKYQLMDQFNIVVFFPGKIGGVEGKRTIGKFLQQIQQKNIPLLLLTDDQTLVNLIPADNDHALPRIRVISPEITAEELWGRICSMLDFSPLFGRMEQYMGQLEKWAFALNNRFEELHQELRLAWRVQQDFLPKQLPKSLKLRFAALYRPASWVSGDIYDIFQVDEKHIGFYIADVVGHGVAAGLMTLFVKRALVTKEILGKSYRLLTSDQAIGRLNQEVCSLELPEHQFVTACYGLVDVQTCELEVSRAGHPHPILIDPEGRIQRVEAEGSLLGVFPGTQFERKQANLTPGSKLFLFTDGLEQAFGEQDGEEKMVEQITRITHLPADQMIEALSGVLDSQENSLHPADDITAVVIESLR